MRTWLRTILVAALAVPVWSCSDSSTQQLAPEGNGAAASQPADGGGAAVATVDLPSVSGGLNDELVDDPSRDGWDTEVINNDAGSQFKTIGKVLTHPDLLDAEHLAPILAEGFACTDLVPGDLETVYSGTGLAVHRPRTQGLTEFTHEGAAGLAAALKPLADLLGDAEQSHYKFKIFTVDKHDDGTVTTVQYFAVTSHTDTGSVEVNATWTTRWQRAAEGDTPMLLSIRLDDYEQSTVDSDSHVLFSECTEAVLGANESFATQIMQGLGHWEARLQVQLAIDPDGHNGIALGDVNGDGLDDLFVCQPGGLPNRLFVQNPDGTATDISRQAGVDILDRTRSALLIDLDNDGDQDLVMSLAMRLVLFENDGTGRFTRRQVLTMVRDMFSITAGDFDGDGDLDLYVCAYQGDTEDFIRLGAPIPYHDASNGGRNVLLRNDGNWQFVDVTEQVGLDDGNFRWSFAAVWEDFDNDGDLDLYVANDFGRNNLYRNDNGRFSDIAGIAGVEDISAGMGVTTGDYNRDGLMDVYVSNMWSSAGNRIAYQRQFRPDADAGTLSQYQRHARGNSMFRNAGDGTFHDASAQTRVMMGRWSWGSRFVDFNNDGWDDLIVSNGFVTNYKPHDL